VKVLKSEAGGVWVTGLPEVATVITVGQEMVVAGEVVDVVYEAPEATRDVPLATTVSEVQGS
jgi:multidrug efflux system membrane fusion protein